ncbi:MAG: translation initiation factor [Thermoleophilaceae bacterium]|nr:translation initiation factor [Thermoleophilaceae bacterium]
MPIPRKFDRRPPERDETRINERIRVPQVRLIDEEGNQVGVVETPQALRYAQERDLDLVEVAADARPPVTRVLDYSKYKYEQEQKAKAARRHQKQVNVREIKLRPKIATNDYETKKNHVVRFLNGDDRVKVTIMFRGREQSHPERGERLLMRLAEDVADLGTIEQHPQQDGRNMTMLLAPQKKKSAEGADEQSAPGDDTPGAANATPAPADATPAPADDAPTPANDAPAPAEATPAPAADAPAPTDDTPARAEATPAPADDAPAPADEQPAPSEAAPAPESPPAES